MLHGPRRPILGDLQLHANRRWTSAGSRRRSGTEITGCARCSVDAVRPTTRGSATGDEPARAEFCGPPQAGAPPAANRWLGGAAVRPHGRNRLD